jgi:hypothetical protein
LIFMVIVGIMVILLFIIILVIINALKVC